MATIKERIDGVTDDVTQGKQNISSAITDKGVATTSSATFSVMADNIRAIESGAKDRIHNSDETIYVIADTSGVTIGSYHNTASGEYSVAEGNGTEAAGNTSHSEGDSTAAKGESSHSEGSRTNTIGKYSHAEGYSDNSAPSTITSTSSADDVYDAWFASKFSLAFGQASHSEGSGTQATSYCSHAEGSGCTANGAYSHAEGNNTQAFNPSEHACGKYNKSTIGASTGATLFSVGFGNSSRARANAIEITQSGTLKAVQAWQTGSDRKLKENITSLENNTLSKVLQLNPVKFTLKSDISKKERIGFIAQEVETVFPEYVTVSVDNEGEETRYLDYSQMVSVLCKSLQEMKQYYDLKIQELESKIK